MSKRFFIHACVASAMLAATPAFAQSNTTDDAAMNMTATDPMAANATDPTAANGLTADPAATDTLTADPLAADPSMNTTEEKDHDDFPWGLLGLLGLAGLLGLKRRDHDDVRVDRTTTGRESNRM